jgi:phospholipid/cholesterol/gamma-HCH transport system permease protein
MEATTAGAEPTPIAPPPPEGSTRATLREFGQLTEFGFRGLRYLPGSTRYLSEALRQAAIIIRGTSLLMLVMNVFYGITVASFAFFVLAELGATDFVGFFSGFLTPRMVAVSMFGIVFVSKICGGITAEIGAMRVQQEIDALESEAVEPMQYIVGTRVLGALLFVPIGAVIALIGQFIGNYLLAVVILHGVTPELLQRLQWFSQTPADQVYAFLTDLLVAVPCVLVACFYGLRTRGGPAEVGQAVSRSLLVNIPLQNIIAGTTAMAYYGYNLHIPFGG